MYLLLLLKYYFFAFMMPDCPLYFLCALVARGRVSETRFFPLKYQSV